MSKAKATKPEGGGGYDAHKRRAAARQSEQSAAGRDIAPIPPVENPERRNRCLDDLELFARTYFPMRFPLPFSAAHRAVMERMGACTTDGGLFSVAFQRGGGKTTMAEVAVIHAVLYGLRRFVVLVQATEKLAVRSLKKIRREFETNETLLADFPEAVYPIKRLGKINNRASGQTLDGVPTNVEVTADTLVLPTVPGSPSSGAIVYAAGLTGAVRGLSVTGPGGVILRPDLCLIDDAQTRESAKSPTQTTDRELIITDDVMGLGGPETRVASINLCTPIYPNDLSERFLSPDKHPEWNGVRTRMLETFPERVDLWDEYAEVLLASLRDGQGASRATAFYQARRAEMDAGAVVTWPERKKAGPYEASTGLELAMMLHYRNPRGFRAEYQCDPDPGDAGLGSKQFDAEAVAGRLNGVERFAVPKECSRLTAFVDCGKSLHWYLITAWNQRGGGGVVDYGCWPRQSRSVFEKADARPSLSAKYPGLNDEQRTFAGLRDLTQEVLGRVYYRDGAGDELRVERCLIDSGFNQAAVLQFIRQSPLGQIMVPSKGMARSSGRGVGEWTPRPGERTGPHWRLTVGERSRTRQLIFDPDEWKSRVHGLLTTPPGDGGGLFFWGKSAGQHTLIGEHCAAESSEPTPHRGGTYDKWSVGLDRRDNDWLDSLVGATVAASFEGVQWSADPTGTAPVPARRKKVKYSDVQARKARERGEVPV